MKPVARLFANQSVRKTLWIFRSWWKRCHTRDLHLGRDVKLGRFTVFETHRALPNKSHIVIGDHCRIEDHARLEAWRGSIEIGKHVFLGPAVTIYGHGGVSIGDNSLIAMQCCIVSSNHSLPECGTPIRTMPDLPLPTKIGSDVWLGAGVTVLGGVSVGDGAVVGAGSVITKDLAPGCIAYGVPATIRGWRKGAQKNSHDDISCNSDI
jgi:acetyltransferase-like isoleucine patch superfamily enzyme